MKFWGIAVALALAVSTARVAIPAPAFRIFNEAGMPLATIIAPGGFTLSFIHSINLSPVDEDFIIEEAGVLRLMRVHFNQLSTGMPSGDEDGFMVQDGRFVTSPERALDEVAVRVSPVPGHTLSIGGKVRPLTTWAPVGGLLVFRAVPGWKPSPQS
ncbi:MAG: DUF1850 domain-containing protein [Spirochaetales bacterium]|nr:DUF1850 domain-containing protein [Spirochaetales bacterium]